MKRMTAVLLTACTVVCAASAQAAGTQLFCHRTANEDVPENTLASLEQAALLGCDIVEIDLRRTRDGEIVLNHDGILERLSDGLGEVENTNYAELAGLDMGSWMSPRFAGLHIARFAEALDLARRYRIKLVLDIKQKGIGADVVRILDQQNMRDQVQFGGEWDDIKQLMPAARTPGDGALWVPFGVTSDQVLQAHRSGKIVVANFSASDHELDLDAMRAAVGLGVDALNVDYPRLGAEAVGRPVELRLHELILHADKGESQPRVDAILTLARYRGFALQEHFVRWLLDDDPRVSRAAAQALVSERPQVNPELLAKAMASPQAAVRANAVWALGVLRAPLTTLLPALKDESSAVLQAALLAVADTPGQVQTSTLLPLLHSEHQEVRGVAARAFAAHQPQIALQAIVAQLDMEVAAERQIFEERTRRGETSFSQDEIEIIMRSFRCQMEMVRAIASIPGNDAARELVRLALRPEKDFSQYNAIVASFQLWDRIAADPQPLVDVLGSDKADLAGRAEWTLAHGGALVMPVVRAALESSRGKARTRAIHILAWQGDQGSLTALGRIAAGDSADATLAAWAIARINNLHPASQ